MWSIINHNDVLSNDELNNISEKTDNDKNTIYISEVLNTRNINIKRVIYLTNTDWLLDKNKKTVLWWKINSKKEEEKFRSYVEDSKSASWTWWMGSKLNCSFEVLKKWVEKSIISNAEKWLKCLKDEIDSTVFS